MGDEQTERSNNKKVRNNYIGQKEESETPEKEREKMKTKKIGNKEQTGKEKGMKGETH